MTIQFLLIFVKKEQSKCQKKQNVGPKNMGEEKQEGMLYLNLKAQRSCSYLLLSRR